MAGERYVKLMTSDGEQTLRIPREFEIPGHMAVVHKEGHRLVVEPARQVSLLDVLASLSPLDEEFPEISDRPADSVEL